MPKNVYNFLLFSNLEAIATLTILPVGYWKVDSGIHCVCPNTSVYVKGEHHLLLFFFEARLIFSLSQWIEKLDFWSTHTHNNINKKKESRND